MADEKVEPQSTQEPTSAPTGDAPGEQSGEVTFSATQQAAIDGFVSERLKRAQAKWEADAKAAQVKADSAAEKARLTEQQEFRTLAEKAEARVAELEPLAEKVKQYTDALTQMLESKRKGLPTHIVELLNKVGDPLEQLTWLEENADKLTQPKAPDIDGTKRGQGKKADIDEEKRQDILRRFGVAGPN